MEKTQQPAATRQRLIRQLCLLLAMAGSGWACRSAPPSAAEPAPAATAPSSGVSPRVQGESSLRHPTDGPAQTPPAASAPSEPDAPTVEPSQAAAQLPQSDDAPMLNALTRAISDSPYSAIVQHTKVEVQRDGKNGDKHIRHARVLETLRGPKMDKITYTMFTEPGESAKPPRGPLIITLCHDADGFYWPGVGSSFPNGKDAAAAAKIAAASAKQDQTVFPNCD